MTITASAPGKLLLIGDHAVVYGRPCLVSAVDQRLQVSVRKNGTDVFHLDAPDVGLTAYSKTIADLGKKEFPKSVAFIEMLYKRFLDKYPQKEGIVVTTKSDFSCQFGFGSSSAVSVAFAKALTTLYGVHLTKKELFDLCYSAVLDVQKVGSGFDLAAAIWGGTIYYVKPAQTVISLPAAPLPLVVGYTGVKADTPTLVRMVEEEYTRHPVKMTAIFDKMGSLVEEGRQSLESGDWPAFGRAMSQYQELLASVHVSSVKLNNLIAASLSADAYGAKLSGAGGGDCMIALADHQSTAVKRALTRAGGIILPVTLNAPGVRLEN